MTAKTSLFRAVATLIFVAGIAHTPAYGAAAIRTKEEQLRQALQRVDRVTIAPTLPDGGRGTVKDIRGTALIGELLDLLDIDESYGEIRPGGPTDATFIFYAGDRPVATLSLRRFAYLHWDNGPWVGDGVIATPTAQKLVQWCKKSGADITGVVQDQVKRQNERGAETIKKFLSHFNADAKDVFAESDAVIYRGRRLRVIEAPLLVAAYTDKAEFAEVALRALAEGTEPWYDDDWASGAVQTALLDLQPGVLLAAFKKLEGDEKAMLGAARFFLRCGFDQRLDPAEADTWALKFAELALKSGRDIDKHAALEYVSRIPGEKAAAFLRAVAQGTKTYTYTPPYDEIPTNIEEPGLPYAAAVLLAKRADSKAADIVKSLRAKNPTAENLAALEVAATALDPAVPLKPSHFKYHSHVIGSVAVDVLGRREPGTISIEVLAAACASSQPDLASDAGRIALRHGFGRQNAETDIANLSLEFDPMLASTHPARAIEQYSALINAATGVTKGRLLALRALAETNKRDYAAAEADYFAALDADEDSAGELLSRLAWVQWYLGKFEAASETINRAIAGGANPDVALLRGIISYAQNDFGRNAEASFIAVMVMDPTEGYAPLFQHLAVSLAGRSEDSRLGQFLLTSGGGVPDWPRALFGFLLGRMSVNRLLEAANASPPNELKWHLCEAFFYAAQSARVAGRIDDERTYLQECIATDQPHVAEFWVAKYRLMAIGTSGPRLNPPPLTPPGQQQPLPVRPPRGSEGSGI